MRLILANSGVLLHCDSSVMLLIKVFLNVIPDDGGKGAETCSTD
jgi:hypothetical protein